jgi:hypothetical protein
MFGILLDKIMPRKEHYNNEDKEECKDNSWIPIIVFWIFGGIIAVILSLKYCDTDPKKNKILHAVIAFFTSYIYIFYILYKMFYSGKYALTKKETKLPDITSTTSSASSSDVVNVAATVKPLTKTT